MSMNVDLATKVHYCSFKPFGSCVLFIYWGLYIYIYIYIYIIDGIVISQRLFRSQAIKIMKNVLRKFGTYENFEEKTGGRRLTQPEIAEAARVYLMEEDLEGDVRVRPLSLFCIIYVILSLMGRLYVLHRFVNHVLLMLIVVTCVFLCQGSTVGGSCFQGMYGKD